MTKLETPDAVVIGCGVIGASVAYYLAERGTKVLIVEKESLPVSGSSSKSIGGVRAQFGNMSDLEYSLFSIDFYEKFNERFGEDLSFKRYGDLFLAHKPETIERYKTRVEIEKKVGTGTKIVSPDEIKSLIPGLEIGDLLGGTYNAQDGYLDPHILIMGMLRVARNHGAKVIFGERVEALEINKGHIEGVRTSTRYISAGNVIIAAGPWSGAVARLAGLKLPLRTCIRQIFVTGPFRQLAENSPFVIDEDDALYFRREMDSVIMSLMEVDETDNIDPTLDWSRVEELAEKAIRRFPAFASASFKTAWAGIRTMTPDSMAILGPTWPEGLFLACGMSGHGFCHAPAVGSIIADAVRKENLSGLSIKPYLFDRF